MMRGNSASTVAILIALAFACCSTHTAAQTRNTAEGKTLTLAGKPAEKFSTAGHAKAKGVDLTIKYPADWKAQEGDRPNIVQKFVNPTNTALVMLMTRTVPGEPVTKEEVAELLADRESVMQFFGFDSNVVAFTPTKLEGEPAAILECTDLRERAGYKVHSHTLYLIFFRGNTVVMVNCVVGSPNSDAATVAKAFESYRALFTLIFSSIVFEDKWR